VAIYNSVILDFRFPMAVFKKLLGESVTFEDLKDSFPVRAFFFQLDLM
jgi:hypothetical protein